MVRQSISLPRARFAGRGESGSDLLIAGGSVFYPGTADHNHRIVLCNIALERSYETPSEHANGTLDLKIVDESGVVVPARIGLYDARGRMPLPSSDALVVPFYGDLKRQIFLRDSHGKVTPWPHANRHIFYVDGRYRAKLPENDYQLVVSHGPEYRVSVQDIVIRAGRQAAVEIRLERFVNMPSQGWYSGDDHVHITRAERDNDSILTLMRAEDIHVTNLLQMGNPANPYFLQYAFGERGRYSLDNPAKRHYGLVPGVEDPRTALRGHTVEQLALVRFGPGRRQQYEFPQIHVTTCFKRICR